MLIDLVLRWMHVLSAIALLGGSTFMLVALLPAAAALTDEQRQLLQSGLRPRWARVVALASGLLLVSGLVNAVRMIQAYEFVGPLGGTYHMLVAVKLILALAVFTLAALLSGRTAAAERLRAQQGKWMTVAVFLGTTLVCMGGLMKMVERVAK